ncbi:hypothetical protein BO79DRAFT_259329 [Aspergillus costaricaensis CBS 115574]|uniref:Uncharacterized protein n=1 Tax=Aspergillus costaricaensis CBS 115574 TaxID=1448317 RepID=A0ACD1I1A5_9EURO|nr:hypothetical protein BO79DRAFT_259329 [Aspergillus costaricaensis CBS 115574]RAK84364.1 hypothetical protein BO79DRAFT_259329 [Aspergillus costaricaensis CBS 115574]
MPHARNKTGKASRHAPLDQETVLESASSWVRWIETGEKIVTRDIKRIHEALHLVSDKNGADSYTAAVRQAHSLGGKELTVIFALAVGKSAFRDTKKELKRKLLTLLAELREFECRLVPEADDDNRSNVSGTASEILSQREPEASVPSEAISSQEATASLASQSRYQTELSGNVYELTPIDLLEISTALVTQKLICPGPLLLTEPFQPTAKPFITIPITTQLCYYLRDRCRQVM